MGMKTAPPGTSGTAAGTVLDGRLSLLGRGDGAAGGVAVRLDAGAVQRVGEPLTDDTLPFGSATVVGADGPVSSHPGWGWGDPVGLARAADGTQVEVRRLVVTDGSGAPTQDVLAAVASVMSVLRTGGAVTVQRRGVGTDCGDGGRASGQDAGPASSLAESSLADLVALASSIAPSDLEALAPGLDDADAVLPDLRSFLDDASLPDGQGGLASAPGGLWGDGCGSIDGPDDEDAGSDRRVAP